jgi:tetrahydromethanopterin S-methyltransferase subunit H
MPAGYQDLFLEQGTTFTTQLNLSDDTGVPYNLSGFTIKSQARSSYYSSNVAINFTANIINANTGTVQLFANSAVTSNVSSVQKLVYDVIITEVDTGTVTRILEGQIFVSPSVTRN